MPIHVDSAVSAVNEQQRDHSSTPSRQYEQCVYRNVLARVPCDSSLKSAGIILTRYSLIYLAMTPAAAVLITFFFIAIIFPSESLREGSFIPFNPFRTAAPFWGRTA